MGQMLDALNFFSSDASITVVKVNDRCRRGFGERACIMKDFALEDS